LLVRVVKDGAEKRQANRPVGKGELLESTP